MAFTEAKCDTAYAKFGILGFTGTGKTFLAKELAIGLHKYCVERGAMGADTPVFFLDTETGSDWVRTYFEEAGVKLVVDKTRAFTRLVPSIQEVEKQKGILIIDSITHYWTELTTSYMRAKNRTALQFTDWSYLKAQWAKFTDAYVNSQAHIILSGRAGFEYETIENDAGKRELVKSGIKMLAENSTGFEASMLILMERQVDMVGSEISRVYRTGQILKDRGNKIDGKVFKNPTFADFLPHIQMLNVGGKHVGVDTSINSESIVPPDERSWERTKKEVDIVIEEIAGELMKRYPSAKNEDKIGKQDTLEKHFGTRSWKKIETMDLNSLRQGFRDMMSPGDVLKTQAENVF